jgi:hypothetical protein
MADINMPACTLYAHQYPTQQEGAAKHTALTDGPPAAGHARAARHTAPDASALKRVGCREEYECESDKELEGVHFRMEGSGTKGIKPLYSSGLRTAARSLLAAYLVPPRHVFSDHTRGYKSFIRRDRALYISTNGFTDQCLDSTTRTPTTHIRRLHVLTLLSLLLRCTDVGVFAL